MFFYKSNQTANCSTQDIQGCFDKLSMGSIGQSEIACGLLNFAKNRELEFSCFTNNAKLTEIKMIGIAKDNGSSCKTLNKAAPETKGDQFYDKCYINNLDADYSKFARNSDQMLFTEEQEKKFIDYYNANCKDKSSCKIPIDEKVGWPASGTCSD